MMYLTYDDNGLIDVISMLYYTTQNDDASGNSTGNNLQLNVRI